MSRDYFKEYSEHEQIEHEIIVDMIDRDSYESALLTKSEIELLDITDLSTILSDYLDLDTVAKEEFDKHFKLEIKVVES